MEPLIALAEPRRRVVAAPHLPLSAARWADLFTSLTICSTANATAKARDGGGAFAASRAGRGKQARQFGRLGRTFAAAPPLALLAADERTVAQHGAPECAYEESDPGCGVPARHATEARAWVDAHDLERCLSEAVNTAIAKRGEAPLLDIADELTRAHHVGVPRG